VSVLQRLLGAARSLDPRVADVGLAVALTMWSLEIPGALDVPGRAIVLLAMTGGIAWRRRAPVAVLVLEVAGVIALPNRLELPQGAALLIAAYSAVFYSERRLIVAALLVAASASALAFGGTVQIPSGLVPLVLVAPVWLGGTAMRRREQRAEASAERADRLERERETAMRAERARIARELHDVVTHSVTVMVLQTGAARQIMGRDEGRARDMLESVEASGRSALDELRRFLDVLSDQDADVPLSPQPGVTEIASLIDQVRQAGMDVELRVEGQPREVSGGLAIAAFRIVQEALTNVLKHAGGAPSRVVLRWADGAIELEILDDGSPDGAGRHDAPAGRGIVGMRERAAMYGGTLVAHPALDRGYVVRARIPLNRLHPPGA
jgi:signal transduction histidine kinase